MIILINASTDVVLGCVVADSVTLNDDMPTTFELQSLDNDRESSLPRENASRWTCICTKILWRFIRLVISLWQLVDMVSDVVQTKKFYDLSSVRRDLSIYEVCEEIF